ncbi:MAG TPA: Crp/Fnr family transcriptional regulator [Gaiellaceae bacterium]|jgi:CRP-like cAMP-binding protein
MQWALLAGVPEEELRTILQVARRRSFARNEVVFHRGDPADCLHLIARGRFAIRIMTPLGDTATVAIRGPGATFGEMALLSDEVKRTATVAAVEDGETYSVYQTDFDLIRASYPGADRFLWSLLVNELHVMNERLLEALYLPVDKRVRRRLVELAELYGDGGGGVVTVPLTQEVIAELSGAGRPTVNQVLREEAKRGTIELERGRIRILDTAELARRAR